MRALKAQFVIAAALCAAPAAAQTEIRQGDLKLKIEGAATIGTAIRSHGRDPNLVPAANGAIIGVRGLAPGGRNQDDGNLNFGRGDPVSSVVKSVVGVTATYGDVGAVLRGKVWYDFTLSHASVPFGNLPGGYRAGAPLDGASASNLARFGGMSLLDAYVFGKQKFGSVAAEARLGNQMILWGNPTAIAGGLFTTINAVDFNALNRPGVLPEEIVVRTPASYVKLDVTPAFSVEGFYQFFNTHNQYPVCGTLLSTLDYLAPGCDHVVVGGVGVADPTSLATGGTLTRAGTPRNTNPQFGFGASYLFADIATRVGAYYAHVNSRSVSVGAINSGRPGVPFIPGNPGGLNTQYVTSFARNIDMFAVNFTTRLAATTIYGEASYKARAPLQLNSVDLLNAFASAVAPTPLRADALATPLGAPYYGFDRRDIGQYQLGATHTFANVLGAKALVLGAEAAVKQVYGLPDVNVRRYGRSDVYGQGPVNGVCPAPAIPIQCSNDGYVTPTAWGYRLKASLAYDNVGTPGLTVTPSVGLAHDVQGWSADGVFNEGRMILNLGLRAEYKQQFFADIGWAPVVQKGAYDNFWDRQVVALSMGMRF